MFEILLILSIVMFGLLMILVSIAMLRAHRAMREAQRQATLRRLRALAAKEQWARTSQSAGGLKF